MARSNIWIIIILLLAVGTGVVYFFTAQKKVTKDRSSQSLAISSQKFAKLEQANEMLEKQLRESERKTALRIKKLNQLLIRELTAREEAEQSAADLIVRAEELKVALQKQEEAIASLESIRAEQSSMAEDTEEEEEAKNNSVVIEVVDPETEKQLLASQELIKEQQALLAQMELEKQRLEEERLAAITRQIELEKEILEEGGEVEIENYELRAPNYRRRHKLFMNHRAISRRPID